MKVLIVDDDESIRKMLTRQLKKHGYEIFIAKSGMEGINILKKENPDVILLDQMMPQMDGITTFGRIKKNNSRPPVIMMTAHGSMTLAVAFMKAGGADFIQKPFDMDVLDLKIRKAMEKRILKEKLKIVEEEKLKLSTMLDTASKMNHEINNPLSVIFNAVFRIKGMAEDTPHIEKIKAAMVKIEKVVVDINRTVDSKSVDYERSGEELESRIKDRIETIISEEE